MPEGVRLQNNITQSVRSKDLDYVALNNLFSADFETASRGKRKYKPGAKLYQVKRLVSIDWSPRFLAYSSTLTGDQIINKSVVVESINFRIALVSFPMPFF